MTTEGKLKERLERIRLVKTLHETAAELGCSHQTVQNWIDRPEHIPAGKIDAIKRLHIKERHRINSAIKRREK